MIFPHPGGRFYLEARPRARSAASTFGLHDACDVFEGRRTLHRARINTELLGNDAHTWSSRSRQGLPDALLQCRSYPRAPQLFALALGALKPGTDSFLNDGAFELGEHPHHLKHRLARRCPGIEALLVEEQINTERVKLGEERDKALRLRPSRSTDHAITRSN